MENDTMQERLAEIMNAEPTATTTSDTPPPPADPREALDTATASLVETDVSVSDEEQPATESAPHDDKVAKLEAELEALKTRQSSADLQAVFARQQAIEARLIADDRARALAALEQEELELQRLKAARSIMTSDPEQMDFAKYDRISQAQHELELKRARREIETSLQQAYAAPQQNPWQSEQAAFIAKHKVSDAEQQAVAYAEQMMHKLDPVNVSNMPPPERWEKALALARGSSKQSTAQRPTPRRGGATMSTGATGNGPAPTKLSKEDEAMLRRGLGQYYSKEGLEFFNNNRAQRSKDRG